ncbi:AcrR family transcriptional regulator [Catenulispora sp. GAS73]|uniref:TetR/AcrR family transcriptional regulator n=1 Tax=Catenulispora sp. GAS73 TaxID=3156269 RepID=UPI0035188D13
MNTKSPHTLRADAARNRAAVIEAAAEVFRRDGADASFEEIARVAKVGSATLRRRFPTRQSLLDAVFLDDVTQLCQDGRDTAASRPPAEALWDWLAHVAVHCAADDALSQLIRDGAATSTSRAESFTLLEAAGEALLRSAVAAGSARADVSVADLLVVVNAIAGATAGAPAADTLRLLSLVRDGARPRDEPLAPLVAARP